MSNQIIKLNISGTVISVYKSTIQNIPFFEAYLNRWSDGQEIFLEEDPKIFRQFLNKLKRPEYVIPEKYEANVKQLCNLYDVKLVKSFIDFCEHGLSHWSDMIYIFRDRNINENNIQNVIFMGKYLDTVRIDIKRNKEYSYTLKLLDITKKTQEDRYEVRKQYIHLVPNIYSFREEGNYSCVLNNASIRIMYKK